MAATKSDHLSAAADALPSPERLDKLREAHEQYHRTPVESEDMVWYRLNCLQLDRYNLVYSDCGLFDPVKASGDLQRFDHLYAGYHGLEGKLLERVCLQHVRQVLEWVGVHWQ